MFEKRRLVEGRSKELALAEGIAVDWLDFLRRFSSLFSSPVKHKSVSKTNTREVCCEEGSLLLVASQLQAEERYHISDGRDELSLAGKERDAN